MPMRRSALRASDADRESVAERLRDAAAEGRLEAHELEHRLELAFSARTYGQLSALIADLPRGQLPAPSMRRMSVRLRPATAVALVVAFPIALAVAVAAIVAVAALLMAWATAVTLVALFLGSRGRAIGSPWAIGCRAWSRRHRRVDRSSAVAGFIPWL